MEYRVLGTSGVRVSRLVRGHRDEVVIATKCFNPTVRAGKVGASRGDRRPLAPPATDRMDEASK